MKAPEVYVCTGGVCIYKYSSQDLRILPEMHYLSNKEILYRH